ncbi:MAG: hypothetical protein N3E40_04800, partial [Dehalococcoidia bacterium]|nr:hypothetical protein [Dehalococcoidia bacterium]
ITGVLAVILGLLAIACPQGNNTPSKASPELVQQVSLRKQQLSSPAPETLARMKDLGMRTEPLDIQRVFIYLKEPLTAQQTAELNATGISVYPGSWVPPTGSHPAGYILAEMPVDKLDALMAKDFVVRLDTAEKKLEPQGGARPG